MDLKFLCTGHIHTLNAFDFDTERVESISYFDDGRISNVAYVKIDNSHIIKFAEDPCDGWRSCLGNILKPTERHIFKNVFPPCRVKISELKYYNSHSFDGYQFIDVETNEPVLIVGTENWDDYYPCYRCSWYPENMGINQHIV